MHKNEAHFNDRPSIKALLTAAMALEASSLRQYVTYALTLGPCIKTPHLPHQTQAMSHTYLSTIVNGVIVDNYLVDFAILPKVFISLEDLGISQSRGESYDKHKIPLHHPAHIHRRQQTIIITYSEEGLHLH